VFASFDKRTCSVQYVVADSDTGRCATSTERYRCRSSPEVESDGRRYLKIPLNAF
jgi:hypothetical protein